MNRRGRVQLHTSANSAASCALRRMRRAESVDRSVGKYGPRKQDRIELGLELLSIVAMPGASFTRNDIALWCGCTDAAIYKMERRALRKLANKLRFGRGRGVAQELAL